VPADGTTAATVGNGNFGISPFFGQLWGKLLLARKPLHIVSSGKHKEEVEKLGAESRLGLSTSLDPELFGKTALLARE
jgi:hypothetical protein